MEISLVKNRTTVVDVLSVEELCSLFRSPDLENIKKATDGSGLAWSPALKYKNNYRSAEYIDEFTGLYGFDIDLLPEYKNDPNFKLNGELDILVDAIKDDFIFVKKSISRKGLHLLAKGYKCSTIPEYKYVWHKIRADIQNGLDSLKLDTIFKIDDTDDPARQFYVSRDPDVEVNETPADWWDFNFKDNKSHNYINIKYSGVYSGITFSGQTQDINNKYIDKLKSLDKQDKIKLTNWLKTRHYEYSDGNGKLGFMFKTLEFKYREPIFKMFRLGTYSTSHPDIGFDYKDFNMFNNYVEHHFKDKYDGAVSLEYMFGSFDEFLNIFDEDILGNKFTYTYSVDKYLSELKDVNDIIFNNESVILKAPAGVGKTTTITEYVKSNPDKKFLFIGSKNNILEKLYEDIGYGEMCYGGGEIDINARIIFSSLKSLKRLEPRKDDFDYIIIDEAHLLINFSTLNRQDKEDISHRILLRKIKNVPTIFISATPEWLKCTFPDVRYVNIVQNSFKKINFKFVKTTRPMDYIENYSFSGKTIVFKNNNKQIEQLQATISGGTIMSSHHKQNARIIVDKEKIYDDLIFSTSYIGEGLNILNDEPITILITIDILTDIQDIYQFISRFRVARYRSDFKVIFIGASLNGKNKLEYNFRNKIDEDIQDAEKLKKVWTALNNKTNQYRIVGDYLGGYEVDMLSIVEKIKSEYNLKLNYSSEKFKHIQYYFNLGGIERLEKVKGESVIKYNDLHKQEFQDDFFKYFSYLSWVIGHENNLDSYTEYGFDIEAKKFFLLYEREITLCLNNLDRLNKLNEVREFKSEEQLDKNLIFNRGREFNQLERVDERLQQDGEYEVELNKIKDFIEANKQKNRKGDFYVELESLKNFIDDNDFIFYKTTKYGITLLTKVLGVKIGTTTEEIKKYKTSKVKYKGKYKKKIEVKKSLFNIRVFKILKENVVPFEKTPVEYKVKYKKKFEVEEYESNFWFYRGLEEKVKKSGDRLLKERKYLISQQI